MRILVDIFHPSNVHFFKHFMWTMQERGHEVLVTSKDKDSSLDLLKAYGFRYRRTGRYSGNVVLKVLQMLKINCALYRIAREFDPDILVGQGSVNAAQVSKLIRKPCILFADDEYSLFLYRPFAEVVCTLGSFRKDLGRKQVRVDSYKELAYLHPKYFIPDPAVLGELDIKTGERFVLIRFVAWTASHDFMKTGFDLQSQKRLIKEIEKGARVFISAEGALPPELEAYRLRLAPERIHHVLYYADLFVGDGQTMATESAVLGTPAVRCNTFVGPGDMVQFVELEKKYGLAFSYRDPELAINKALELLSKGSADSAWDEKRARLLSEKTDISKFMVDFVENYPASFNSYKAKSGSAA